DGGLLDIGRGPGARMALVRRAGAEFRPHTAVRGLAPRAGGVTLTTDDGTLEADHVVLCVASWLRTLLGDLGLNWRITLSQEQVSYFATPTCATSPRTGSRCGSGTASTCSTASPFMGRWPSRRPRTW